MKEGKIKRGFYFLSRAVAFIALAVVCALAAVSAIPVAAILDSVPVWVVSGFLAAGMVVFIVLAVSPGVKSYGKIKSSLDRQLIFEMQNRK